MAADRHRRPGLLLVASRCPRGRFALPAEAKSVSGRAHAPVRGGNDWISDSAPRSPPTLPKSRSIVWFVALPVALVFEFFYFAQYGRVVQWTIGAASALLLGWGAIWQLVLVPRSAIYVDDLSFGKVSGFGRRKSWDRSEAAGFVLSSLDRGRRVP